ncbi:MAG: flagellar biosynthetic protein FliR [Thiovulaceae bacterium]|nr:flagellar biosynthetic protein FliR [Sulfurimonadaceae bacterium]
MDFISLLTQEYVVNFFLLYIRFSALLVFLPIFSHMAIPARVKVLLAFYFTIMFYSEIPPIPLPDGFINLSVMILSEIFFALMVGLVFQIVLAMLAYAGEQISFIMGFTMASVMDPQTQTQAPLMSAFLSLIALMLLLAWDVHHLMIEFMHESLKEITLGGFTTETSMMDYFIQEIGTLFVMGLTIAFPILALSLLVDIIFGMLMKTMPQFNLLVIGFPIKIGVSFTVLMAVLTAMMVIFQEQFFKAFNALEGLF